MGETSQGSSYFREDFPWSSDRRKMVPRTEIAHTMTYTIIGRRSSAFSACARHSTMKLIWKFDFYWFTESDFWVGKERKKFIDWRQLKVFAVGTTAMIKHSPDDEAMLWCGDMKELSFAPWYGDMNKSLWYLYEASVACGWVAAANPAKSNLYA